MTEEITLSLVAKRYEDHDDCLAAAADDIAAIYGLEGWNLNARWQDDSRETILVDLPGHVRVTGAHIWRKASA